MEGASIMENQKAPTSRDLQAIERKKQLLASAKMLFAKNGYHNTSVRDIIENAGIASGLIYHYFPEGKQEMLDTIVNEGHAIKMKNSEEILNNIHNNTISLRDGLITIGKCMIDFWISDPELTQILLHEQNFIEQESVKSENEYPPKQMHCMIDLLKEKAAQGEIKVIDYKMAMLVLSSCFNYLVSTQVLHTKCPVENVGIVEIVDYLLELWKP
jgi:AcrR family transcriptional regulator